MEKIANQVLTEEVLNTIAKELENSSKGRITVVTGQKSMSGAHDPLAGTFIKLDGKRISEDFSHYIHLANFRHPEVAITEFTRVLYLIRRKGFEDAYVNATVVLSYAGEGVFSSGRHLHFVKALA
jgi:hypothetical protein